MPANIYIYLVQPVVLTLQSLAMALEDSSVCRLGLLYCKATWVEGDLFLTLMQGTQAYSCQLEGDDFRAIDAKTGGMGGSEAMAREAFAGPSEDFSVEIEAGKLLWKKVGARGKLKLYGVELSELNFVDAQKDIFDHLVDKNRELQTKNRDYSKRQENLVGDLKKSRAMLKDFEKTKNEIEDRLYESFLPILNAKKAKIAELQGAKGSTKYSDEEGDDYGSATDEDVEEAASDDSRGEKRKGSEGGGGTSKASNTNMNDSLDLLGDF